MLGLDEEDPPIHPEELRSTIWMISDIRAEMIRIRRLLEGDDGEEEAEADDT